MQSINYHDFNKYLPNGALYLVIPYFEKYNIHFTISKERKTILGNYIFDTLLSQHRITVNGSLNKQAFLVTLLHEIAHLITFEQYKNKVSPHGTEWKNVFKNILTNFIQKKIFPDNVEHQLLISISNLKASSCSDIALAKVLKQYDEPDPIGTVFIEDIKPQQIFIYEKREFKMLGKVKKRYQGEEIKTKRMYLFYALCKVIIKS